MTSFPPVRTDVLVGADQRNAFEVFTGDIGRWWPVAQLSVYGAGATVTMANDEIVEGSPDGHSALWGTITRWDPPSAVAFTWHPGQTPDQASHVEATFTATGTRTLVVLTHTGWDVFDDPSAARAEYEQAWPLVLGRYQEHLEPARSPGDDHEATRAADANAGDGRETSRREDDGNAARPGGETWVALLHRPGPAAPREGSVFKDPRFTEHIAFLARMREAGYLVAAGPLTDEAGAGMTILRLPGEGQFGEATRLATEDDTSVAGGFFTVDVRPWHVVMQAGPAHPDGP